MTKPHWRIANDRPEVHFTDEAGKAVTAHVVWFDELTSAARVQYPVREHNVDRNGVPEGNPPLTELSKDDYVPRDTQTFPGELGVGEDETES